MLRTLAVLLLLLCWPTGAAAAPPSTRVLVVGHASAPLVERLRDELALLEVEVLHAEAPEASSALASLAEAHRADAVLSVAPGQDEVVVWVREREGPAFELSVRSSETRQPPNHRLLALRAVELLRGRLIDVPRAEPPAAAAATPEARPPRDEELRPAPAAAPAASAPAPRETAVEPPEPQPNAEHRSFALLIAPTLTISPGGMPPMGHMLLEAGWWLAPRFELAACTLLPISSAAMDARGGALAVQTLVAGAGVRFELLDPEQALSLGLRTGLGVLRDSYERPAAGPFFPSIEGSDWALLPWIGAGVGWRLDPAVMLRTDALLGYGIPELEIRDTTTRLATFGRPAAFFSLGFEAHL